MNDQQFEKLSELIESLPANSITRANLTAVRGSIRVSEDEERRLYEVLRTYAVEARERLRKLS